MTFHSLDSKDQGQRRPHRSYMGVLIVATVTASFAAPLTAPAATTETHILASQVLTLTDSSASEASTTQAIGGTRLRAIGGTRLRAETPDELQAIGGTFLRAIGGTRLREAGISPELLAIGGTRLRSDADSELEAIGGTRLRAIGGTRLRSDEQSEALAIGGTRLRAIGGTRLRSDASDHSTYAIGGTRLRAIGGTRLRSNDIQSVQAIGGTRLRAIESDQSVGAIGGTRLRNIESESHVEAIGGTRLRAIGGTRLRAIGGTRLRGTEEAEDSQVVTVAESREEASSNVPLAILLDSNESIDFFAYGPVTAIAEDGSSISVMGQAIGLAATSSSTHNDAQVGKLALIAGDSNSQSGLLIVSDEWHIPGSTAVSLYAPITSINPGTASFTLDGGVVVDYTNILAMDPSFEVNVGDLALVSGIAF